jgi:hypothetical protein
VIHFAIVRVKAIEELESRAEQVTFAHKSTREFNPPRITDLTVEPTVSEVLSELKRIPAAEMVLRQASRFWRAGSI